MLRLQYGQSVLISSPIAANPPGAGAFSPTTPYVDETAGFGEEFNSARAALSSQSDSPQASAQTTNTDNQGYGTGANGTSIATRADGDTPDQTAPDQTAPDQTSAQTPDRPLISSAVRQSVTDSVSVSTMKVSPRALDKATPRVRDGRLSPAGAQGNRSSQDQSKTPGAPSPAPPTGAVPVTSALLVPTVPVGAPVGSSRPTSSGAGPLYNVAKRISGFTDSRICAPSGDARAADDPVATAGVANSSAGSTVQNRTEALAFAVKVQSGGIAPHSSIVSAGQQVSGNPPVAGADDASSQAHATRQKAGSDGDQGGSLAQDPAPKDAEKSKATSDAPAQNPPTADGSTPIRTGAGSLDAPGQPAVELSQSGSRPSDQTARTVESASLPQPTPPQGPMKELSIRMEAAEGQKVDVRFVQRAGDLQIAVKSGDDITTQGLRHGLSDLANRLNETGYHAETWRPGQQAPPESSSTSSENQSQSDGSQSNSGGPQQDRGQRHNNPSNRPPWIDELESNLSGATESSGQFNGIVSQPTI